VHFELESAVGFALHYFVIGGFNETVRGYWLAAISVVVIGAPVGAMICAKLSRTIIVRTVLVLISIEVFSTLLIIPLRPALVWTSISATAGFLIHVLRHVS